MKTQAALAVTVSLSLELTEAEAAALVAVFGHPPQRVLDALAANLGTQYTQAHDAGLRAFMAGVTGQLLPILQHVEEARRVLRISDKR